MVRFFKRVFLLMMALLSLGAIGVMFWLSTPHYSLTRSLYAFKTRDYPLFKSSIDLDKVFGHTYNKVRKDLTPKLQIKSIDQWSEKLGSLAANKVRPIVYGRFNQSLENYFLKNPVAQTSRERFRALLISIAFLELSNPLYEFKFLEKIKKSEFETIYRYRFSMGNRKPDFLNLHFSKPENSDEFFDQWKLIKVDGLAPILVDMLLPDLFQSRKSVD